MNRSILSVTEMTTPILQDQTGHPKKTYLSPALVRYGCLTQITGAMAAGQSSDGTNMMIQS